MTNPAIDRITRAHKACTQARMEASHERDDITGAYDAVGRAESAFSTAVTDAFKVGEDEIVAAVQAGCRAAYGNAKVCTYPQCPCLIVTVAVRAAIASMFTPSGEKRDSGDD